MIALAAFLLLQTVSVPPTAQTFTAARAGLDRVLIDYPRARFRDVTATDTKVCGWVNGPNRLGGYAGWQRFVVSVSGSTSMVRLQGGDDLGMIAGLCDGETRPPASPDYSDRLRSADRRSE